MSYRGGHAEGRATQTGKHIGKAVLMVVRMLSHQQCIIGTAHGHKTGNAAHGNGSHCNRLSPQTPQIAQELAL
jgi:hypothetical protein